MQISREEGQRHKTSDSAEAVATAATAVVIAAVEVVGPQSPGEPHHHHHHHDGTETVVQVVSLIKRNWRIGGKWRLVSNVVPTIWDIFLLNPSLRAADISIRSDDVGVREMTTDATRASHLADDKVGQTKWDLTK
ncbi:hypothetical protein Scep_030084 [Stephania cephalantha]|uniref:Uncharacterized protein n=1 Tax=Stephania cephalantha TaxID=152367 RepID=A0AAP0E276_9MAGN